MEPATPLLIPVVAPDLAWGFVDLVAPGPTLPSLDAPGAGCICAEARDVARTVRRRRGTEIALGSQEILLLEVNDAGIKTDNADLCSRIFGFRRRLFQGWWNSQRAAH